MAPRNVTVDQLAGAAEAALSDAGRLERVGRLTGGTRKGVYRLTMQDGSTAVAYLWEASESFWTTTEWDENAEHPFSPGCALDLFEASRTRLEALGLRVPEDYLVDRERAYYPSDIAIIEDFPGENLMEFFARDPEAAAPTMDRLAQNLDAMRNYRAPAYGKVALIDMGGKSPGTSCESDALAFGLQCLAEASSREPRVEAVRGELEQLLRTLAAAVPARAEYSVVHGELGLDHVLVDRDGLPVIIDIEDLMYFDVEWEHVFLRIRLHADYARVAVDGLDEARIALYMLVERISLTAGFLRLLASDFPDREFLLDGFEHNLAETLAWLADPASPARVACCRRECWGLSSPSRSLPSRSLPSRSGD